MFYEETKKFLNNNVTDLKERAEYLRSLKAYLSPKKMDILIDRIEFIDSTNMADNLKASYKIKTNEMFPRSFIRDTALIDNSLSNRRMSFSNDISLVGPEENFEEKVKVFSTVKDFSKEDFENKEITILVIEGKPS
jgi:hypothetical protein